MRVALAQFDIQWENPSANMAWVENQFALDADLIVFPEMFLTGFTMEPNRVAEKMDSQRVQRLQELVDSHNKAILGSMVISTGASVFNRMMFFTPKAIVQYYDKRHLFSFAGEHRAFTPGTNNGLFVWKEWKICGRICYDLRFPVWSRNTTDYDILVYVANWPKARHHAWLNLLHARAIENQCFVIGVNRIGKDANDLNYLGGSLVVDYNGDTLAASDDTATIQFAELSKQKLLDYRKKLPFLVDRDKFELHD